MPSRVLGRTALHRLALAGAALCALPLGAQEDASPWRLEITPIVGRSRMGALVDHSTTRTGVPFAGGELSYRLVQTTEARLALDRATVRGARLDAPLGARWSAFVEATHGSTRLEYRQTTSAWNELVGEDPNGWFPDEDMVATSSVGLASRAAVSTLTVGARRAIGLPAWLRALELRAGGGASIQRVELYRAHERCLYDTDCSTARVYGWKSRYSLPGIAGTLGLRLPLGATMGIEARTLVTLARARIEGFGEGAQNPYVSLGQLDAPSSSWVPGVEFAVGVSTRVAGAKTSGASPPGAGGRLRLTPLVGLAVSSPLLDRTSRTSFTTWTTNEQGQFVQVPASTTVTRRMELGDAAVAGVRVEYALGRWAPFAEAAMGRAPFLSVDSTLLSITGQDDRAAQTLIMPRAPASVGTLVVGATRTVALRARDLSLDVGGGAALQWFGLDRISYRCPGALPWNPGCVETDGWKERYWAPGAAGVAGVRWSATSHVAVEARSTLTLVRAPTGGVTPSGIETLRDPNAVDTGPSTWVRGARLALGVALSR